MAEHSRWRLDEVRERRAPVTRPLRAWVADAVAAGTMGEDVGQALSDVMDQVDEAAESAWDEAYDAGESTTCDNRFDCLRSLDDDALAGCGLMRCPVGMDGRPIVPEETVWNNGGSCWCVKAVSPSGLVIASRLSDRAVLETLDAGSLTHENVMTADSMATSLEDIVRHGNVISDDGLARLDMIARWLRESHDDAK